MSSTPRPIDAGVRIGEIFVDKYRVDAILGHGGMGVVALCTHLALNEEVAIKMLRRDVLDDADAVERFMREAQAASKLRSEYVARVTDVGRSGANVPYMVMEYLEGHDLDELLADRGTISQPWAVELTLQACEALSEAHSLGIVHRDIKPSNLFVTWRPDGTALIKVLDFGISKALVGDAMQLTQTQSLLGTPAYMSPEQMRSARNVDARTDIWSLGTVLYEMLEGRRPFEAVSFSEMCVKVAVDPPGEMPNTPLELQQVVLRCLAKPPEQRYASMAELGRDLVPFSRDPHQAHLLAERMARTLRRSQVIDWEPALAEVSSRPPALTPVPGPRIPLPPILPPSLEPSLPPAAATAATEPAMPAPRPAPSPAAAAPSLSSTYRIPRRKSVRVVLATAAAVVIAAAIGIVASRTRSDVPHTAAPPERARPAAITVEPADRAPASPAGPNAAAAPAPTPVTSAVGSASPADPRPSAGSDGAADASGANAGRDAPPTAPGERANRGPAGRNDGHNPRDRRERGAGGRPRPAARPQGPARPEPKLDDRCAFDSAHDGCAPAGSGREDR